MEMSLDHKINTVMDRATCLIDESSLNQILDQLAEQMGASLKDKHPLLLCVMRGGMMVTSELTKRLPFKMQVDYLHATRYQGQMQGAQLEWKHKPGISLKDRVVVLVDDILDGGVTLAEIKAFCEAQGAKQVQTAVLLDKKAMRHPKGLKVADFVGIEIENHFVFGFGLDYYEHYRNLPAIYQVDE